MSFFIDANWVAIFLLLLITLIVIVLAGRHSDRHLPKYRLERVGKPSIPAGKPADDIPSIVRRQYSFLKRGRSKGAQQSLYALAARLDSLIQASGWQISVQHFLIIISTISISVIVIANSVAGFGLILTTIFVAPLCVLIAVRVLVIKRNAQLRQFQSLFPEALDLIVRSVRAGLPVAEAIKLVGAEVADPVGSSFRDVGANLTIGLSLDEALRLLEQRRPIVEVKFFATSLVIQQETGGNIVEILANLAYIMRKRVQLIKKTAALSAEGRASAVIIGSLPLVVGVAIFFLNRDYMNVLFFDEMGRLLLYGAIGSIVTGAAVMARLIRFEI